MNTGDYGANAQYRMGRLPENTQVAQGPAGGRVGTPMPTTNEAKQQERLKQMEVWNQALKHPTPNTSNKNMESSRNTDDYQPGKNHMLAEADTGPAGLPDFSGISSTSGSEPDEEPPKPDVPPTEEPPPSAPAAEVPVAQPPVEAPPVEAPKPPAERQVPPVPAPAPAPPSAPAAAQQASGAQKPAAAPPRAEKSGGCCVLQ